MNNSIVRMCVIDDIRSVVDMITTRINWSEYGVELVGSASDGEEGYELIQRAKPDLVLTDIRMPKLDGLELTRLTLEQDPTVKVIILSAYSDFEYAQQALRLGAFDFLKKPVSIPELIQIVLKAKEAWQVERREQYKLIEMERRMKESLPALRQEYLTLLLHHASGDEAAMQRWEFLQVPLDRQGFNIFLLEIDKFTEQYQSFPVEEIELIRFSLQNIIEETVAGYTKGLVFRESFNRFVCIANATGSTHSLELADRCCANIARYTRFTISVGVGATVRHIHEWPTAYEQALKSLSYHFFTGGNGAYRYEPMKTERSVSLANIPAKEQEFLFALRSGNEAKSIELLEDIFADLTGTDPLPDPHYAEQLCNELAAKTRRVLLEKFAYEQVAELEAKSAPLARQAESPSIAAYKAMLLRLCQEGCALIQQERTSESKHIIHRSMAYIREHLDQELSLEHCAKKVNLSWGYYSSLFKKVAGVSFLQFVTQEKIEKAKKMLLDDYQVQEIAAALGYEHRRYFSELFKKQTGQTPTEFKESYTGKPAP
ncbi:response regulator [Paenibacillus filicis]|uniref:Response regulator n=1 Tax=Paenibacillus filicis TaxID=669464 RepID=A0ABU9DTV1_9BACL